MFKNIVLRLVLRLKGLRRLDGQRMLSVVLTALLLAFLTPAHAAPPSETKLPPGGQVVVTGSVTLADLISQWADDFASRNPSISITAADPGGAVGLDALLNSSADVVLASTSLNLRQTERFADRFGYAPTSIPVAMDGVVVYVNTLNPLRRISLAQLDAIYSATLRCGARQPLRTWGKLGVKGTLSDKSIATLGLTVDSGANLLFKQMALCDGDFRADFQALAGPEAVEAALTDNPAAIGFSSSALRSAGIQSLAIARRSGEAAIPPSVEAIQTRRYPLTRTLDVILNIPPGRNTDAAVQAFLDYARSATGQAVATKAGYVPLPTDLKGQP